MTCIQSQSFFVMQLLHVAAEQRRSCQYQDVVPNAALLYPRLPEEVMKIVDAALELFSPKQATENRKVEES